MEKDDSDKTSFKMSNCSCECRHGWRWLKRATLKPHFAKTNMYTDIFASESDTTGYAMQYWNMLSMLHRDSPLNILVYLYTHITYEKALYLIKELSKCECCEHHKNKTFIPCERLFKILEVNSSESGK